MSTGICHGMRLQVCRITAHSVLAQSGRKSGAHAWQSESTTNHSVPSLAVQVYKPHHRQTFRAILQVYLLYSKSLGLSTGVLKLAVASPALDLALAVSYRSRKAWPKMKSSPNLPLLLKLTSNKSAKSSLGQS